MGGANSINNSIIVLNNNGNKPTVFEHEPQNDKANPMKIIFVNQTFGDINILIDSKKTIDELIKFYFETCGKKDLYGDNSILFLINGNNISFPYPKDSVETFKNKVVNSETIRIVVTDSNDKIRKINT